jgi:hypothetical protein
VECRAIAELVIAILQDGPRPGEQPGEPGLALDHRQPGQVCSGAIPLWGRERLLANRKYSIDYYQREYKWQRKQITELLEDLAAKFLDSYVPQHERRAVANYGHYFLGSIVISDKAG